MLTNKVINTMLDEAIGFTKAYEVHSDNTMINTRFLNEVELEVVETLRSKYEGTQLINELHVRDLHDYMTEEEYEYYYYNIKN